MPNRTIYIADADLAVFEKARELAGDSLSATIVQALRRFIQVEEGCQRGFAPVEARIDQDGAYVRKRFVGRLLARIRRRDTRHSRISRLAVYETAGGRFAVLTRTAPDWNTWQDMDWSADGSGEWWEGESRLDVYEDQEALRRAIPAGLWESVARALKGEEIELLDI